MFVTRLTLSSCVSVSGFPSFDQFNFGVGRPVTSHSNFIFCPALAIIFESGVINAGILVGSNAKQK